MECIFFVIDWILFVAFAVNGLYLFVYSLAARCRKPSKPIGSDRFHRFAILIPAYKEDAVIKECVQSCLAQDYSSESFDIVVISDHMSSETNAALTSLPIRLIEVFFEKSTKSKALNHAMATIGNEYDIAVILDADNVILPNFLKEVNDLFVSGEVEIAQAHRVAKNLNNRMALLDAASEEINNSIFRLGHANLGMSAALIGSGMAFRYDLFRETMLSIDAVGGFDRALELTLLFKGKRFYYLPHTDVYDEKIQSHEGFSRQRRRWLSAQWHYCRRFAGHLVPAIRSGRWDFCDKLFQQFSIPRLLLLGFIFIIATIGSFLYPLDSIKWWSLFSIVSIALFVAIPSRFYTLQMFSALLSLPYTFLLMVGNIFKLRGANKTFIHTSHGTDSSKK